MRKSQRWLGWPLEIPGTHCWITQWKATFQDISCRCAYLNDPFPNNSRAKSQNTVVHCCTPPVFLSGSLWFFTVARVHAGDAERYEIILVSSINHFVYTPLLPSAATGSVEERSIVEPVRRILNGKVRPLRRHRVNLRGNGNWAVGM
jgi:hypothetical protein